MGLTELLTAVQVASAAAQTVENIYKAVRDTLNSTDQQTAAQALAEWRAANDEGFKRLDQKLAEAEQNG